MASYTRGRIRGIISGKFNIVETTIAQYKTYPRIGQKQH